MARRWLVSGEWVEPYLLDLEVGLRGGFSRAKPRPLVGDSAASSESCEWKCAFQ